MREKKMLLSPFQDCQSMIKISQDGSHESTIETLPSFKCTTYATWLFHFHLTFWIHPADYCTPDGSQTIKYVGREEKYIIIGFMQRNLKEYLRGK